MGGPSGRWETGGGRDGSAPSIPFLPHPRISAVPASSWAVPGGQPSSSTGPHPGSSSYQARVTQSPSSAFSALGAVISSVTCLWVPQHLCPQLSKQSLILVPSPEPSRLNSVSWWSCSRYAYEIRLSDSRNLLFCFLFIFNCGKIHPT